MGDLSDCGLSRPSKVGWTFLEKRSDCFLAIRGADSNRELAVLCLRGFKEGVAPWLFHEPFRSLQRCRRFFRQFLGSFCSGFQQLSVWHDTGDEAEFCGAVRIERQTQLKELGGAQISDAHRDGECGPEFRNESEIDEGHLEFRGLAGIDKIAVCQHGGAAPDCRTVHSRDDWLFKGNEGIDQTGLRTVFRAWRILQKVIEVVSRTEGVSRSVPKHDADAIILCCSVEEIRHGDVHGGCHRVFLGRSIELDSQDSSGAFGNNVRHRVPPAVDSRCQACGTAPFARKPSISSLLKPSCLRISSLCSPSSGARRAGTFAVPCTLSGLLTVSFRWSPAPSSGTITSFASSCGSVVTSFGLLT